ncbi:MAG: AAA family ATPase [Acidobacteriota bacterium]|nr:AAA family ATPase [Acidobacteriota bacterium]
MQELSGYRLTQTLLEDGPFYLARAVRLADGKTVLLRVFGSGNPNYLEQANFKNEYAALSKLDIPGVLRPVDLICRHDYCALISEDFDGAPAHPDGFFQRHGTEGFLKVAASVARTLAALHQREVIHQNLRPTNILYNEDNFETRLIGFRVASGPDALVSQSDLDCFHKAAAYLSPEQTGRLNMPVTHYSDLYSLGITLYALLCGRLPFESEDPMEMVHYHIAMEAEPPAERDKKIPEAVSRIIMRLLNKVPEERYQSGDGLAMDLEHCLRGLDPGDGSIALFDLGAGDTSQNFRIPDKLYGRDPEIRTLFETWDMVREGGRCFLPVSGASGMGKSSLVESLRPYVVRSHGFFVRGRCDRTRRDIPYDALGMAMGDLVGQILACSPQEVAAWKQRLLRAMGGSGRVMTDLVPELRMVIGEQPELTRLESGEAEARFKLVLHQFLEVFAEQGHPLIIFLADLQWAGKSMLSLLDYLIVETDLHHFLVVGSYSGEISVEGPKVEACFQRWRECGVGMETLSLAPLDRVIIQEILLDALGLAPENSRPLADLVMHHTSGVPFDVRVYLKSLYDEGKLFFDPRLGDWRWDESIFQNIEKQPDDPISLITRKIVALSRDTRGVLELAACIGNRFTLRMLSIAWQRSQAETAGHLREAMSGELVQPLGDAYKLLQVYDPAELEAMEQRGLEIHYRFSHNRVREAVYSLMDAGQSRENHVMVGRHFLKYSQAHALQDQVFSIVSQLNQGSDLIDEEAERYQLAELNRSAGVKACGAAAYGDAVGYFRKGLALLTDDAVKQRFRLWFSLTLGLAEAEFFNRQEAEAERLFGELLSRSTKVTDKAQVFRLHLTLLHNAGRLDEAVDCGCRALDLFGMEIPADEAGMESAFQNHYQQVHKVFAERGREHILSLPVCRDSRAEVFSDLVVHLVPPAYNCRPSLFRLLALLHVTYALEHGNSALTPFAYATYGVVLGQMGDYEGGFEMGRLALELNVKFPSALIKNRLLFIGCNLLNPWRRHLSVDLPVLRQIFRAANDCGDLVYANYATAVLLHNRWVMEAPLLEILDQCEQFIAFADRTRNPAIGDTLRHLSHTILNLRGLSSAPNSIDTPDFDTSRCEERIKNTGYMTGLAICRTLHLQVLYLRGFMEAAEELAVDTEPLMQFAENTAVRPLFNLFYGLALAARLTDRDGDKREEGLQRLQQIEKQFRAWSDNCAENFEHRHALIRAELYRVQGEDFKAQHQYNEAIRAAARHGYGCMEAVANERAAAFLFDRGFRDYALTHLDRAFSGFERWGATAVCRDLKQQYAAELAADTRQQGNGSQAVSPLANYSQALDRATLFKAAQALTAEIHLEPLLRKMMRFVSENAGAQRGLFLLAAGDTLVIEAEWHVSDQEVTLIDAVPLSARSDIAKPVIHYVFRTRSDLLIDDVARDKQFLGDHYLIHSGVKSVLCVPIIRQTELVGIVYLENHLMPGAFTHDRLELLRMLAPQIAVSISNARFISNMEALNATLKSEITERKKAEKELKKAQQIALANARNAGKAEFATSVLHNINNVLNSVSLSCQTMNKLVADSNRRKLGRAMAMISENRDNLGFYLTQHPKGKLLPGYLEQLTKVLTEEHLEMAGELTGMDKHLELMKGIIKTQQKSAKGALSVETLDPVVLMEDAVSVQAENLRRHSVRVIRRFETEEPVKGRKAELIHILINLIKNAVEAMGLGDQRILTLETILDGDKVLMRVCDSGVGITREQMVRMFTHGFTTKEDGHGFGLAYCKREMKAMDGDITVTSEGKGRGATFELSLVRANQPKTVNTPVDVVSGA